MIPVVFLPRNHDEITEQVGSADYEGRRDDQSDNPQIGVVRGKPETFHIHLEVWREWEPRGIRRLTRSMYWDGSKGVPNMADSLAFATEAEAQQRLDEDAKKIDKWAESAKVFTI